MVEHGHDRYNDHSQLVTDEIGKRSRLGGFARISCECPVQAVTQYVARKETCSEHRIPHIIDDDPDQKSYAHVRDGVRNHAQSVEWREDRCR